MDNTFKNRFKKFFEIAFDSNLSIKSKFKKFLGKEDREEMLNITFNKADRKEEFYSKISSLTSDKIKVESNHLASVFCLLIQTKLSTNYKDKTLTLLEKVNEKDIINTFDYVVKYDNLIMCEEFLNNNNPKYKNILSTKSDYSHYLCLSVEYDSTKITEYFLKNPNFYSLLCDPIIAETTLRLCLLTNNIEITNMLLSQNINLDYFKEKNWDTINLDNDNKVGKNIDVITQIKKRLLHEELMEEFVEDVPEVKKTIKRPKL